MAFKDYMQCGAEETVQWIKYVPQRHEDLSSDYSHISVISWLAGSSMLRTQWEILPASINNVSCQRRHLMSVLCFCTHVYICVQVPHIVAPQHRRIHMHKHTHRKCVCHPNPPTPPPGEPPQVFGIRRYAPRVFGFNPSLHSIHISGECPLQLNRLLWKTE